MKRIRGGRDVWWWDEQPIYEATHRRAIAAGKRRMRRDDVVRSGQDLAARDAGCRRHRARRRRGVGADAVVAEPVLVVKRRGGRHGTAWT